MESERNSLQAVLFTSGEQLRPDDVRSRFLSLWDNAKRAVMNVLENTVPDLPTMFEQAVDHHRAGRYREAAAIYDVILQHAPHHADTLHLRGFAAYLLGDYRAAVERLKKAITQQPNHPIYHAHLGMVHQATGDEQAARKEFDTALKHDSAQADALAGLGSLELSSGANTAARDYLLRAVRAQPVFVAAWANLAQACFSLDDFDGAGEACQRAIAIDPNSREARFCLALVHRARENKADAEREYRAILANHPRFLPAALNLANLLRADELRADERVFEADEIYRQAVLHHPQSTDARYGLATLLHESGRWDEACTIYRQILAIDPTHADAAGNLGSALRSLGKYDDAIETLQHACQLNETNDRNWINLGNALAETGAWNDARQSYKSAVRLSNDDWLARLRVERLSPILFESEDAIDAERSRLEKAIDQLLRESRSSLDGVDLATSGCEPSFNIPFHGRNDRAIKEKYSRLFEGLITPIRRNRGPSGSLPHVGIVVTDSNEPLFVRSMMGVLNRINPSSLRLSICCSARGKKIIEPTITRPGTTIVTLPARFSSAASALAQASFDLLYFWEIGTDAMNYFLPFVQAAPVQCTSWGIQVTSGLPSIDYYLSCRWNEPADAEIHYTEKLVLLDWLPSFQERLSLPDRPMSRDELGVSAADHLYVCAQNPGKFHPAFRQVLAEILNRDLAGKLIITGSKHPRIQEELRGMFQRSLGGDFNRLVLLPPLSRDQYHRLIAASDVLLDPFPFAGVNSTYDGFSMNRLIVTMEGSFQRGRFTCGCYRTMGLEDWITSTPSQYVERALAWGTCRDERKLAAERLVERTEVLFHDPRPATELEQFFLRATSGG